MLHAKENMRNEKKLTTISGIKLRDGIGHSVGGCDGHGCFDRRYLRSLVLLGILWLCGGGLRQSISISFRFDYTWKVKMDRVEMLIMLITT